MALMGNLKQTDPELWIGSLEQIQKVFGYNIFLDDNPFKVTDLWRTTTKSVPTTDGVVRIRFVDKQEIFGVPKNDGNLFGRIRLYHHPLGNPSKTMLIKSCAQIRVSRTDLPKIKGNLSTDDYQYFNMCKELGFNPFEADVISTFDNVKNKSHSLSHGDIVEIPIEDLRIIGMTARKGKSSFGIQLLCMGSEIDKFTNILKEHGIEERAQVIKDAMTGKLEAVLKVMDAQRGDTTLNDNSVELYMRCALFAVQRDGEWHIPMFTKNVSSLYVRLNRMLSNEIMRLKVSAYSPYIMPWDKLDHLEAELHKAGTVVRFYVPPNNRKMKKEMNSKKHTIIGSNPVVAPFSIQTFVPLRENVLKTGVYTGIPETDGPRVFNGSKDTIEISNQSAYMMFRDFDGDKVTVCFTDHEPPRTYRTVVVPEAEKGPKPEPPKNMDGAVRKILAVSTSIAQSALDTGRVDLACREVYVDRLNKEAFLSLKQAFQLGWMREKEIQGLKWTAGEAKTSDTAYEIKKNYGLVSPDAKRVQSLEYQLVHRHAFLPVEKRSDKNIFNRRLEIINTGKVNTRIPHWLGFKELKDTKITTRHEDSILIKQKMTQVWNGMVVYYRNHAEEKGYPFTLEKVKNYGNLLRNYFADMSKAIQQEWRTERDRKQRSDDFRLIGRNIRVKGMLIETKEGVVKLPSLEQMREKYGVHAKTWERYLATYLCTTCFGGSVNQYINRWGECVNPYSLGGGPLGYLSDDAKLYVGIKFNPDNPELKRATKKLEELGKLERAHIPEQQEDEEEVF
jgi:hypothetical protein